MNLIKNIFIPEQWKGVYLFGKRVLGFDIGKTHINAAQVYMRGNTITIEKTFEQPLETTSGLDYDERAVAAITKIFQSADSCDAVYSALSSSQVIFKELKLPFTTREQIALVINYEIEPLLPFALADAIVDFTITKVIPEEKSAEVLVVAAQKQYIAQHKNLFDTAKVRLDVLTVDMIALYGLYAKIPAYNNLKGGIVLIELEAQATRMAYIYDGQLRFIRSLPKGLFDQAKIVGEKLGISTSQALEDMVRFGFENQHTPERTSLLQEVGAQFWQEIAFSLRSFSLQNASHEGIQRIILVGQSTLIKGIAPFITHQLNITTELFDLEKAFENKIITHDHKNSIIAAQTVSIAVAAGFSGELNLLQQEFEPSDNNLLLKQLITTATIFIFLLGMLIAFSILQTRKLNKELESSQQEVIQALQDRFPELAEGNANLDNMISDAETALNEEEKLFEFATAARSSFLKYLLELTNKIDKNSLDLEVEKITIGENTITFKGQVKDYDALIALEREIRQSKLFKIEKGEDNPQFNLVITIVKNAQGQS